MKKAVAGENSSPAYSLIISIRGLPNGITFRMALTSHNLKGKVQEASPDIFQNQPDLKFSKQFIKHSDFSNNMTLPKI